MRLFPFLFYKRDSYLTLTGRCSRIFSAFQALKKIQASSKVFLAFSCVPKACHIMPLLSGSAYFFAGTFMSHAASDASFSPVSQTSTPPKSQLLSSSFSAKSSSLLSSQTAVPLRIAIVQMEKILGKFQEKLKNTFSEHLNKYHNQFLVHEEKLRQEHRNLLEEQKLLKKEDTKAQEEWAKKMHEFETRVMEIQKIGEEKRRKLDQQYSHIMEKIYHELHQILKDLAAEKNIHLFLKDYHVLHWDPNLDITDIAYARLKGRVADQDLMIKESDNG